MPAKKVFLDTNGWIALLNAADALHAPATALWTEIGRTGYVVFVTDWIVAETGNGLARTTARAHFNRTVEALQGSKRARLIFVSRPLLEKALLLYSDREDKTWGLVDCASFTVMREKNVTEAFTNDRHFEQAGFKCLL